MLSRLFAPITGRRLAFLAAFRPRLWRRPDVPALGRRLSHFWIVWSVLLLVHESGHAVGAWRQGLGVARITAGVGPVIWRGHRDRTEIVLRLVPIAGVTTLESSREAAGPGEPAEAGGWRAWGRDLTTIAGGVLATLGLAIVVAGVVALRERATGTRWRWGRFVVADALVLTLFNFLPVPPLDGGRAVIGALTALRGVQLTADALFWVQVGGLALAVVPMTFWTRWTARIDEAALRWGAPTPAY